MTCLPTSLGAQTSTQHSHRLLPPLLQQWVPKPQPSTHIACSCPCCSSGCPNLNAALTSPAPAPAAAVGAQTSTQHSHCLLASASKLRPAPGGVVIAAIVCQLIIWNQLGRLRLQSANELLKL